MSEYAIFLKRKDGKFFLRVSTMVETFILDKHKIIEIFGELFYYKYIPHLKSNNFLIKSEKFEISSALIKSKFWIDGSEYHPIH